MAPQTDLTAVDTAEMRSGGIGTIRIDVYWPLIESVPGQYQWSSFDSAVSAGAENGIQVLPFIWGTPQRFGRDTELPVEGEASSAWASFLQSAVTRYGPGGSFWREHSPGTSRPLPELPIRTWQIWNEPNFFYFATPASPQRYAQLVKASSNAIKSVDPGAKILLAGLFGVPKPGPPHGMPAAQFLGKLYKVAGIKQYFDGVALHPYAAGIGRLEKIVSGLRKTIVHNGDRKTGLYITEIGWGSQNDPRKVAFEVGWHGQARALERAYGYLVSNRGKLKLKGIDWFTWKDAVQAGAGAGEGEELCNFCDSTGLFRAGEQLRPKPAWSVLTRFAHGKLP